MLLFHALMRSRMQGLDVCGFRCFFIHEEGRGQAPGMPWLLHSKAVGRKGLDKAHSST